MKKRSNDYFHESTPKGFSMLSLVKFGLVNIAAATYLSAQAIQPLDYFPMKEGNKWKYNGTFLNEKGVTKKYRFTIEVQGVQAMNSGNSFTLFRSSYGSGPNDEPEFFEYRDKGLVDVSSGLTILREQMKEGDSWQSVSKEGKVQGKATVLRFNYSETVGKIVLNNCIKMLIENNVYKFIEEITFSKGVGPIKFERFQTMDDYKKRKPSGTDLIRLSK